MPRPVKQTPRRKKKTVKKTSPKSTGFESKLKRIDEDTGGMRFALYGLSGSGKTTVYSTFPKPLLSILSSGCMKPGELKSIDTPENRKTITKLNVKDSSELSEVAEYQRKTGTFATIVVDHLTGLQDQVMKEILGLEELPAQGSWGMAAREDWQTVGLQVKERLREILNLDCKTVLIAQQRTFQGENDGEVLTPLVGPGVTPSIAGWVNHVCDYVCQTYKKQKTITKTIKTRKGEKKKEIEVPGVTYCLRTMPDATYQTKFRVPKEYKQPEMIIDPDYSKIMQVINGEYEC